MLHRVFIEQDDMLKVYNLRRAGLAYQYSELINYLDRLLKQGFQLGSLEEAIKNPKCIHLTFDDGYKEHLAVAKLLKQKYNLSYKDLTFCINVCNCMQKTKICTDIFYYLWQKGKMQCVNDQLKKINFTKPITIENFLIQFQKIKDKIFSTDIVYLKDVFEGLCNCCIEIDIKLPFLEKDEIIELSQKFSIASHAMYHRYLDCLKKSEAIKEINDSKIVLEKLTNTNINIFCYPDGRSSKNLKKYCQNAGYNYALGIGNHTLNKVDPFNISRSLDIN